MADRPILFSAPMVRALLEGRKTQTRRALKIRGHRSFSEFGPSDTRGYDWHFRDAAMRWHDLRNMELVKRLSHAIGDRLWVRETWASIDDLLFRPDNIIYRADPNDGWEHGWRPSIFMPRWASRLTLIVTDVRVQRLQDISEEDAIAEGVVWYEKLSGFVVPGVDHPNPDFLVLSRPTAREMYAALWDTINGSGAWLANPWVAAYTFTAHRKNIDQMGASHAD